MTSAVQRAQKTGDFNPAANISQIMTMTASKGLEIPVVALRGVGHMLAAEEDEKEATRVFYVASTRATQRLLLTASGEGGFINRFHI